MHGTNLQTKGAINLYPKGDTINLSNSRKLAKLEVREVNIYTK